MRSATTTKIEEVGTRAGDFEDFAEGALLLAEFLDVGFLVPVHDDILININLP
jgi:hypothetical protein